MLHNEIADFECMNPAFKEWFLNTTKEKTTENTFRSYVSTLKKVGTYEVKVAQKDLFDFNHQDIKDMLSFFRCKTENSITSYSSLIKVYLAFSKLHNQGSGNIQNFMALTAEEVRDLVNPVALEQRYVTREELFAGLKKIELYQDKVIPALLFEGIMGKDYEALRNLKKENVDIHNNLIKVIDKLLPISAETSSILYEAIHEKLVSSENKVTEYKETEYVLKMKYNSKEGIPSSNLVKKKLIIISQEIGKPFLTGKTIYLSGLAERIIKSAKEKGLAQINFLFVKEYMIENNEPGNAADMQKIIRILLKK